MLQEKFPLPSSENSETLLKVKDIVIATDAEGNEVEGALSEITATDGGVIRGKIMRPDGQELYVIIKSKKENSPYKIETENEDTETLLDSESEDSIIKKNTKPEESLEDFLLKEEPPAKTAEKGDILDLLKDDAESTQTESNQKPESEDPNQSGVESILSNGNSNTTTFNVFENSNGSAELERLIANAPLPPNGPNPTKSETEATPLQTEIQPIATPVIESSGAPLDSANNNSPIIESSNSERIEITGATPQNKTSESPIETLSKKRGRKPKPVSIDSLSDSAPKESGPDLGPTNKIEISKEQPQAPEPVVEIPESKIEETTEIPTDSSAQSESEIETPTTPELNQKENQPEKELTIEEKLVTARAKYIEYQNKNDFYEKSWKSGQGRSVEEDTEATLIKNELLGKAKEEYLRARGEYLKEKLSEYENGALARELRTYYGNEMINIESHTKERLLHQSAIELHKEFKLLEEARIEGIAKSKNSTLFDKALDRIRAFGKSYSAQPARKKILLGLALGAGGGLAALSGGGVMGALGFIIGGGKILQKIAAGSATFVTTEALVKRSQDKKLAELSGITEKEMLEKIKSAAKLYESGERASGLKKFLEARNENLEAEFNERHNDIEKTKRRMAKRRILYSTAAGVVIGSGVIAKTLSFLADASGIHPLEGLKDKVESILGKEPSALGGRSAFSPEPTDATDHLQTENAVDIPHPVENHENILNHAPASSADQAFEGAKNLQEQISKPIATIKSGGNIWETAKSLVGEGKITESEFRTAWGNTTIEVNGVETPISEVGLSHPGDQLIFVGGPNPHFEISSDFVKDHLKLGTNEDLYKYLKSTGKPIPSWLIEKFGK